ncbi:hypothetical protein [Cupriavidus consociatus]|uniref:hypothetical protein n=1 Tax=Cupriavidus consociatus TaxID=2821357 RepID=UPI001AE1861C|nr:MULTISPECIES: hypothetical protein [unclassified Cupriavidus]MBP0624160.1 hypothetical protein [Cupriavidus sp. LEh25]MDK2660874.1 hypothetical protein [Cupriavidus sp. LEh21]
MSAADRFIDGQDRLAALLKALPGYLPPERLAAAVQAAAHAAQHEADARRAGTLPFAAPPGLASAVLEEAARLQAAQAGRRDALLAGVVAGQPAAQALGAPVSAATRDWLAAQARSAAAAQAIEGTDHAGRTEQARTARARRWWRSLGAVASVAAVAGLTTSIVLRQIDEGALQPAAEMAVGEATAPDATPAAGDAPASTHEAPVAAPAKPAPPAPKASASTSASKELRLEREATPRPRVQPPAERKATPRGETPAMPAPAPAIESLRPQAPAVAASPPMPAYSAMAESARAPSPPPPPPSPPAPPAAAAPRADFARKAAPPLAAARAPAALAAAAMVVSVQEDPAAIAARMQAATPLGVWAAEPDSEEIREWVERLWQSLPAGQRPPLPYAVQPDRTLAPGRVRIEVQHRAPQ